MNIYKQPTKKTLENKGATPFEAMSLEKEMKIAQETGTPINKSMNNVYFTRRKDGVLPATDCRTDKWALSQQAMKQVNEDFHNRIQNKLNKTEETKAE